MSQDSSTASAEPLTWTWEGQMITTCPRDYAAAGLSVLPIKTDGTKRPRVKEWGHLQKDIATPDEIDQLFRGMVGVAIIGGRVSGGLECLDIDAPDLVEPFEASIRELAPGLLERLPTVATPRNSYGGRHYRYRIAGDVPGNTPLARSEPRPQFNKDGTPKMDQRTGKQRIAPDVLIETRGEGGYAIAPGSPGECQESGLPYKHVAGPPLTEVPTITADEHGLLWSVARSFNRHIEERDVKGAPSKAPRDGLSPGDDFNARATWEEILEPADWQKVFPRGDVMLWRRPGKQDGASATTGIKSRSGNELFCVFSSNAHPFEGPNGRPCSTYSKFAAFATLNHNGDMSEAAKALAAAGYGDRPKGDDEGKVPAARRAKKAGGRIIVIGTDEYRVNDQAITALATSPYIFQRGGKLAHVVRDIGELNAIERPKDSPTIINLPLPRLRELLSEVAAFVNIDAEGKATPARPPVWCFTAVDARGQWPEIRRLEAVVETPVLLADGTVLQKPGYDPRSGLLYEPQTVFPPVPDQPSKADAMLACDALREVIVDFPFKSDAHASAWLSGVLTPFGRQAFRGPAPFHLVDANVRGAGKSLTTDCIAEIVTGREFPRTSAPDADEEFRKVITSVAILGEQIMLLDNIEGAFGCSSINAALTATSWTDRILGKSEMIRNLPLRTVWYGTGNNVQPHGDTARRTCHIRIESREESPEERTGFRHPNLLAWVRTERPRLVVAALTVLRAYCIAGRPDQKLTPWGSFEGWSGLIRSALVWAKQPDPAQTRIELRQQSDRDASTLRLLVTGWEEVDWNHRGITVAAAIKALEAEPEQYEPLRAAFTELTPAGKPFSARGIGMRMAAYRQRVTAGKYLDSWDDTKLGKVWKVYAVDTRDTSDTFSATPHERHTSSSLTVQA